MHQQYVPPRDLFVSFIQFQSHSYCQDLVCGGGATWPVTQDTIAMLHCPRCSGPLHVDEAGRPTTTQQQQQPQPQQLCPAGNLCPYQQQQQQQQHVQISLPTKAANYSTSGGGIVREAFRDLGDPPKNLVEASSSSSSQCTQESPSLVPGPPPPLLERRSCAQGCPAATVSPLLVSSSPAIPPPPPAFQVQWAPPHVTAAPQLHQTHFTVFHQSPLLITSTIQPAQPTISSSLHISHPATPAIVVGSASAGANASANSRVSPFFPPSSISTAFVAPQPPPSPEVLIHEVLKRNKAKLEQCMWYYPTLRWNESSALLENTPPGTFLVRDSADVRFLFSLSVQRSVEEGPTSVRIHFQDGKFKLDAVDSILGLMPKFSSVVELIDHYLTVSSLSDKLKPATKTPPAVTQSANNTTCDPDLSPALIGGKKQAWVDALGKESSPITLKSPLFQNVPSLAHFSRLAVGRNLRDRSQESYDALRLPQKLEGYLKEYPHRV